MHVTMDKVIQIIVWSMCCVVLCSSFCFELPEYGRKCHCKSAREIKCLSASLGRLPRINSDIQRIVESLILRANLISSISDEDLIGYEALRLLDLRLQRTGEMCVTDFRRITYPHLYVQGLCRVSKHEFFSF